MENLDEFKTRYDLTQDLREVMFLKERCYQYAIEYFTRTQSTITSTSDIIKKAEEIRKYIMKPVSEKKIKLTTGDGTREIGSIKK